MSRANRLGLCGAPPSGRRERLSPHRRGLPPLPLHPPTGNLAKYLGLEPVKTMYVTVPVNFILVGFARDGAFNVELTENEIRKWRAHLLPPRRLFPRARAVSSAAYSRRLTSPKPLRFQ